MVMDYDKVREFENILKEFCHRDFEDYITGFDIFGASKKLEELGYTNSINEWEIRADEQDRIRKALNRINAGRKQEWEDGRGFRLPKVFFFTKRQWSKFWQERKNDTAKLKKAMGE